MLLTLMLLIFSVIWNKSYTGVWPTNTHSPHQGKRRKSISKRKHHNKEHSDSSNTDAPLYKKPKHHTKKQTKTTKCFTKGSNYLSALKQFMNM